MLHLHFLRMFPCQTLEVIRFEHSADRHLNLSSGDLYHLQVKSSQLSLLRILESLFLHANQIYFCTLTWFLLSFFNLSTNMHHKRQKLYYGLPFFGIIISYRSQKDLRKYVDNLSLKKMFLRSISITFLFTLSSCF